MRPLPARLLLSSLAAISVGLGVFTGRPVLFVVAAGAIVLLATSLATARLPLTRSLSTLRGQKVDVLLWGAPPPEAPAGLVLTSVNTIGPGVHVFLPPKEIPGGLFW